MPKKESKRKYPKYTQEQKLKCCALWSEGFSMNEIAKIMGFKNHAVVSSFRQKKDPVDWDAWKKKYVARKMEQEQKKVSKSLKQVKELHAKALETVLLSSSSFLAKAGNANTLDPKEARLLLFEAIKEHQKLFMPIEQLYGPLAKAPNLMGARMMQDNQGNTEVNLLAAFNDAFEESNPEAKAREKEDVDEDEKYIEG